jgi:hypothetical protein
VQTRQAHAVAAAAPVRKAHAVAAAPVRKGTVTSGPAAKKKPIWVDMVSKCPKGYFVKKTVFKPSATGVGGKMMFWCWPNPAHRPKPISKVIQAKRPRVRVVVHPVTPRGGVRVGHINVRGPVVPAGNLPPGTVVATSAGTATVVATSAGNVAVPGAVPAPEASVGSTVSTEAGPATVVATPSGNVAVPESMAPPEDEWANDSMIDDLLGPTKDAVEAESGPSAETQPGAPVTSEGPVAPATPAEAADIKKKEGGVGKLAMYGGAAWLALRFFL